MQWTDDERVLELVDVARRQRCNERIDDPLDQAVDDRAERGADDDGRRELDNVAAHQKIPKSLQHDVLRRVFAHRDAIPPNGPGMLRSFRLATIWDLREDQGS